MFSNEQIQIDELPKVEHVLLTPLPVRYKYTQLASRLGVIFIVVTVLHLSSRTREVDQVAPVLVWLGLIAALVWVLLPIAQHRVRGFAVRQRDLIYQQGLIWKTTTALAFSRVQHIEIKQSLLGRWFSLASLDLFTAGGSSGDLKIPGLDQEQAKAIKQHILHTIAHDE